MTVQLTDMIFVKSGTEIYPQKANWNILSQFSKKKNVQTKGRRPNEKKRF